MCVYINRAIAFRHHFACECVIFVCRCVWNRLNTIIVEHITKSSCELLWKKRKQYPAVIICSLRIIYLELLAGLGLGECMLSLQFPKMWINSIKFTIPVCAATQSGLVSSKHWNYIVSIVPIGCVCVWACLSCISFSGNAFKHSGCSQILFNQYANYFNWNSNQNALHSVPFRSHRRYRSILESCCTTQYLWEFHNVSIISVCLLTGPSELVYFHC